MTIGYIGDTSTTGVVLNSDGTLDYSGGGPVPLPAGCVAGGLDANGNTIVSCGIPGAGGSVTLPPTCMPGDTLSAVNGAWICSPASGAGLSMSILLPIGILAAFAIMGARR